MAILFSTENEYSARLVAVEVTEQTENMFRYLVINDCLITGEHIVFLNVKWSVLTTCVETACLIKMAMKSIFSIRKAVDGLGL